jgi:hypothetical protein
MAIALVLLADARVYHRAVPELYFLCSRRAGLTHAQYAAHLLERHAPLALRHHAGLRGYVLNVVDPEVADPGASSIDSVNALSYDSLADFELRNYDSAEGERLVTEDHARFLGGAAGYVCHTTVFRDVRARVAPGLRSLGVKWICALRRSARLDADRFASVLQAELVPEILAGQSGITRLAIAAVERKLYPVGDDWDAFVESSFDDASRAPLHPFDSFDCAVSLRGRVSRLCDATAIWRVAEHVRRDPA